MIYQKTYLKQGAEVTVEFSDPYFEESALRRVRDVKIYINGLKSRGGNVAHRRISFDEMRWEGDRMQFKNLEPPCEPGTKLRNEISEWVVIACKMIKEAQERTHKYD